MTVPITCISKDRFGSSEKEAYPLRMIKNVHLFVKQLEG